jgi:kynurenine formamidase
MLVSVYPTQIENGDKIIMKNSIEAALEGYQKEEALMIRSLPNRADKIRRMYSGTNPTYLHHEAITFIIDKGIKHLLVDLPSVDREEDGGKLLAHKAFWNYPDRIDYEKTITELIFVPDELKDGSYYINIQIPPFELDAAPSRVLVYYS